MDAEVAIPSESTKRTSSKQHTILESQHGRTSIIVCAVDGTVYTIDADTGTVRGVFTSGDALIGGDSFTTTGSTDYSTIVAEKIVPGWVARNGSLDGYLYKLSPETNSIVPFMNVTDVMNSPIKTCHPVRSQWHRDSITQLDDEDVDHDENSSGGGRQICGIVTGEKKSKIFALNVQTGSLSWIHSDGMKYGDGPRSTSFGEAQHHSFATPPTAEESISTVLLQREDYLIRHFDELTGETNWDVRLAYFHAWEFPSFTQDKTATTASTSAMAAMVAPRCHNQPAQQLKATPVEGSIYSSVILPRKSTIPELRASPHLSPTLPSIAFSEDGKHLIAVDTYSRNILWRKQMPSIILHAYGVTSDNSWIQLHVVDERDYVEEDNLPEKSCSITAEKNEGDQSKSTHVPSPASSVSLLYNTKEIAAMDNRLNQLLRVVNLGSTLFVSPRGAATSLSSIRQNLGLSPPSTLLPTISNAAMVPANFNGIGLDWKEQHQLALWNKALFADSPWTTPSFGKFHKLEHGLFLTWQGVIIVAALLVAAVAFVRFSYLRQKQKWMQASASSQIRYSTKATLDSTLTERSTLDASIRLPIFDSSNGGGGKTLKKRTSSLPIIRQASFNGDYIDPFISVNSALHSMSPAVISSNVPLKSNFNSYAPKALASSTFATGSSSAKTNVKATTSSDESGSNFYLKSIPSSVDGIPLVRYSRYKSEFNDLSSLGKGGFGTVFRCKNVLDGREYAVKKIRIKSFVDELGVSTNHLSLALRRVLREVKILALLDHPNIVRYYTAWLEIDDWCPVLDEACHGETHDTSYPGYQRISVAQSSETSRENLRSGVPLISSLNPLKSRSQLDFFAELQNATNIPPDTAAEDLGFTWDNVNCADGFSYSTENSKVTNSYNENSHEKTSSSFDKMNQVMPSVLMTQRYILYIQMQLCSQSTLSDFLASPEKRKRSSLPLTGDKSGNQENNSTINIPHALQIFSQIARGVKHVHAQGLIHRDLKPSNCFIDEMGTVKIGDFGLSRETVKNGIEELDEDCEGLQNRSGVEHAESITAGVGTRSYASPEQMNGSDYDASTDVYSLGIILFELCYSMNTSMERHLVFSGLRQRVFPTEWISTIANTFPTLHDLVYTMLSPIPSERPSSAIVASHIDKLLGEFMFSLGRGWERKGERPLLLRVEAVDVEGVLPRTVNLIKSAASDADIVQYGLKGQGSIAIMEFAIVFSEAKDDQNSSASTSIPHLEIFRTLSASDEIKLIREVSTDLCPNLESMDGVKKYYRRRSSSLII